MSRESIKFELIALSKVEVSGVEYASGDSFSVSDPGTARWLISRGIAKSASSVEEGAAEGSAAEAPSEQKQVPDVGKEGTSNGQASSQAARKGRGKSS